jgi:aminoglycoside phosphotransferase (APT) family kinase protein
VDTAGRGFSGAGRGGDLQDSDEWMETCFARSRGLLPTDRLRELWEGMRELPDPGALTMTHGDLIPGNLLLDGDRLVGVLDGGAFGPADPSLDLVAAWHLLEADARAVLRAGLGSDDLEWSRGRAWAFQQAMGLVWYYAGSNPTMSALGRRTLGRILDDEQS